MAKTEEGGATAIATTTTTSSYDGGAGGKFRKKPFRRQKTPYDRPPSVIRANSNESNVSWLTKLLVDPASKLISYGAHRFFGSILQRRLPPPSPSPTQAPEVNHDSSGGFHAAAPSELVIRESSQQELNVSESSQQELKVSESSQHELKVSSSSQLINNSNSDGTSELEQLLKQNTFTRLEIDHLTKLLLSRAVEEHQKKEATSVFGKHEFSSGGPSDDKRNEGIRFHGATSTPIFKSKVLDDDIGSPAELAKAYMGCRPSKVSPSMLGMNSHREDTGLLNNIPTSKSPILPYKRKGSVSLGATENGFTTPRPRGRSAVYNMARSPYSRVHPTSFVEDVGINNNDFRHSTPSSSFSLLEHGEKIESIFTTLKRRSSFLNDDVVSVGPIRRIRQKHNLLAPRVPHSALGAEIGSAKQKLPLIGQGNHDLSKAYVENENGSMPSISHASVPSKSSEVASRILQHLEKLSPKEKSLMSKSVAVQDKSPFKLTPGMLRGQALRSMDDVGTSKFMLDIHDDSQMEDRSKANLSDSHDSTSRKHEKVVESVCKESIAPIISASPAMNNDIKVPLKISGPSTGKIDSLVRNGLSQPPQKRAFRMSAQEDSFEQEYDIYNNGLTPSPLSESEAPIEAPLMESKLSTFQDSEMVKTTIQPEVKSMSSLELRKTSEFGGPGSGKSGEASGGIAVSASSEVNEASQSAGLPPPATAFDKPKDDPPLISFSSKVSDKFSPLPSESSSKMSEPKLDSSSSSINTSAPNGSQLTPGSQNGDLDPLKVAADKFGKSDTAHRATNGPIFGSQPPAFSFNATSSDDTNQVSTRVGLVSTLSASISSFASTGTGTTTSAASIGSIFGSTGESPTSAEPVFKFASADPSTSVSAPSTANISKVADAKTEEKKSFGSSNPTVVPFSSASSGSSMFGLTPLTGNSLPPFNPQSSMFSNASKSTASGNETAPQGSSVQPASSTLPPFTTNSPYGSSFSNSQPFNSKPQFSLSSSPDTDSTRLVNGPTPTVAKFGASPTTASDNNAVGSNSNFPGIFTFNLTSSSTSSNTTGSSTAAMSSTFFSSASSSAPAFNTSSSFSNGTSEIFNFQGSSNSSASSSAAARSTSSSSAPNVFGSFQSSPIFGSTFASSSSSTGFTFSGLSTTSAAPTNTAPSMFSTPSGAASFSFTASSFPDISTQSGPVGGSSSPMFPFPAPSTLSSQPVFGATAPGFGAFPGNDNQMNAEDSMAEDPVHSTTPIFGQPMVSPSPPGGFMFGQTAPQVQQANNLFQFGGQSSGIDSVSPNPFHSTSSLEFNTGGSFSLGSGGGDKSNRRTVKINRNKNRRKGTS